MKVINDIYQTIKLDNNYFFQIIEEDKNLPTCVVDIKKLKVLRLLKKKEITLKIDFNKINKNEYKKILKKLLFIKRIVQKRKIKFGIQSNSRRLLGYILNYNESSKIQNDFISAINAIFYNTKFERYNYIYDATCEYLDGFFYGKNLCDFKDNKCGEKRNTSSTTGCCHHFKYKKLGPWLPNNKLVLCEYLNKENYSCDAKCISCKLFTCDYLKKKGVRFRIKDILLLNIFFNPLQKYFIKYKVFTPKKETIKTLMRTGW